MTGWGMATDRQRYEAAGFAAHILKPGRIEDIEAELARLLRTDSASPATGVDGSGETQRAERLSTC